MYASRRNFRIFQEIGVEEHDDWGSDLKAEVEMWPFRAGVMHPVILIGTVRSLWTWLWGRYRVPQNVFLVYFCTVSASDGSLQVTRDLWYQINLFTWQNDPRTIQTVGRQLHKLHKVQKRSPKDIEHNKITHTSHSVVCFLCNYWASYIYYFTLESFKVT